MSMPKKIAGGVLTVATVVTLGASLNPRPHPTRGQAGNDLASQYAGEQDREASIRRAQRNTIAAVASSDATSSADTGAADADRAALDDLLDGK